MTIVSIKKKFPMCEVLGWLKTGPLISTRSTPIRTHTNSMTFSLCPKPGAIRKYEESRVAGRSPHGTPGLHSLACVREPCCQTPRVDRPPCAQSPWPATIPFYELPAGRAPFPRSWSTSSGLLSLLQMQVFWGHRLGTRGKSRLLLKPSALKCFS